MIRIIGVYNLLKTFLYYYFTVQIANFKNLSPKA